MDEYAVAVTTAATRVIKARVTKLQLKVKLYF